jgi:hypothetical protein
LIAMSLLVLAGCRGRDTKPVEDVGGGRSVSRFVLWSIAGTRNGDRLNVRAVFDEVEGESITVDLRFAVGMPTRLESGTWNGLGTGGGVRERSVNGHRVAVVPHPAQQSIYHRFVAGEVVPLIIDQIRSDDRGVAMIALLHQLEKSVRLFGL